MIYDLKHYVLDLISGTGRSIVYRKNDEGKVFPSIQLNEDIVIEDAQIRKGSVIIFDENDTPSLVPRQESSRYWQICDASGRITDSPQRDDATFARFTGMNFSEFRDQWQKRYENTEPPHAAENIYRWDLGHFHDEIREMMREQRDHVEIEARVQSAIADLQALKIHPGMDRLPEIRDAVSQMELALSEFLDNGADKNALLRLSQTNASIIRMFSMYGMSEKERTERYILLENTRNLLSDRRSGFVFPDLGDLCQQVMESVPPQYREKAAAYRAEASVPETPQNDTLTPDRRSNQESFATGKGSETTAVRENRSVSKSAPSRSEALHLLTELGDGRLLYISEYAAKALLDMRRTMVYSPDNPNIEGQIEHFRARVLDSRSGKNINPETFTLTMLPPNDFGSVDIDLRLRLQGGESIEISWSSLARMLSTLDNPHNAILNLEHPHEMRSLWGRMLSFRNSIAEKLKLSFEEIGNILDGNVFNNLYTKARNIISSFSLKVKTKLNEFSDEKIKYFIDKVKNEKYRLRQGWDYPLESKSPKEMVEQIHRDMIILDEYALNTLFEAEGAAGKVVRPLYSMITAVINNLDQKSKGIWISTMNYSRNMQDVDHALDECLEGMVNAEHDIEDYSVMTSTINLDGISERALRLARLKIEKCKADLENKLGESSDTSWFKNIMTGISSLEFNIARKLKKLDTRRNMYTEPELASEGQRKRNEDIFLQMAQMDERLGIDSWKRCLQDKEGNINSINALSCHEDNAHRIDVFCLDKVWNRRLRPSSDLYIYLASEQTRHTGMCEIARIVSEHQGDDSSLRDKLKGPMYRLADATNRADRLLTKSCNELKSEKEIYRSLVSQGENSSEKKTEPCFCNRKVWSSCRYFGSISNFTICCTWSG